VTNKAIQVVNNVPWSITSGVIGWSGRAAGTIPRKNHVGAKPTTTSVKIRSAIPE
jgi:hypothetical protein